MQLRDLLLHKKHTHQKPSLNITATAAGSTSTNLYENLTNTAHKANHRHPNRHPTSDQLFRGQVQSSVRQPYFYVQTAAFATGSLKGGMERNTQVAEVSSVESHVCLGVDASSGKVALCVRP